MDIKVYIESGILESYALGLCNKQEAREVEEYCALYPELKDELLSIQQSLNAYASAHAAQPAAETKANLFAQIDQLEKESQNKKTTTPLHTTTPQPAVDDKVIRLFERYRKATAIAASLFVVSLIGNLVIYSKYKAASNEVIALNAEKQVLADNMQSNKVKLDGMSRDMAILTHPDVAKVMMKGVAQSPQSMAMVYWNKTSKEVYLEIKNLPEPEAGKQYQLWAIVEGKPVDAGMITLSAGDSSLHKMKDFETAQAFAITLEKEGGSPAPTLTAMYVMGAVSL